MSADHDAFLKWLEMTKPGCGRGSLQKKKKKKRVASSCVTLYFNACGFNDSRVVRRVSSGRVDALIKQTNLPVCLFAIVHPSAHPLYAGGPVGVAKRACVCALTVPA